MTIVLLGYRPKEYMNKATLKVFRVKEGTSSVTQHLRGQQPSKTMG